MRKTHKKYRKDQRYFVEKEKIEKYLTCSICQEIFDDPFRITCGHTFCKKCLNEWEKKSKNSLCPLCREEYIENFSGKDLIAQSMINDALVTCIYKGCPWKEKLSNLYNHIQNCLFEPGKLPTFMKKTDFFEKDKNPKKEKNPQIEESEDDLGNICSFNYTSSIKERIFARNPNLVEKLFGEENKEKKDNEKNKEKNEKIEKISENEDVNEFYNLLFDNKNNDNNKIKIIDNKKKDNSGNSNNENINENENKLQGSSVLNIFLNPTITFDPNSFLNKKTDRDNK